MFIVTVMGWELRWSEMACIACRREKEKRGRSKDSLFDE